MRVLLALLALPVLAQDHLKDWQPVSVVALQGTLHHVQGIDVEGELLWVSSVDAKAKKGFLSKFSLPSGRLLEQVEVQEGARIHPGGIMLSGDSIWVPVAEYHRNGATTVQKRDKRTLALTGSFSVADHIGCVAVGPDGILGGNWDSRTFYVWRPDGTEVSRTANPNANSYQDLKWWNGMWMGSGGLSAEQGAVDWLEPKTYRLVRRVITQKTDRGIRYTNEGMAFRDDRLYLLPEDDPSRLFIFAARK